MKTILFVCVENSCRSQIAEAFAKLHSKSSLNIISAGSNPSGSVNPKAIELMDKLGYELTNHYSKSVETVIENVDYLVPHQANKRIIDATINRINLSQEKVLMNISKYGNTTAATIPLLLHDYESKFKLGDSLVFSAFGGGFTWGSSYLTWAY